MIAAYPNYGSCVVTERIPGAEWDVTWGNNGSQRFLTVDVSNAAFPGTVLDWVIADGVPMQTAMQNGRPESIMGSVAVFAYGGLRFIGAANQTSFFISKRPVYARATDGTNAKLVRVEWTSFIDAYTAVTMNTPYTAPDGNTYYLVNEEPGVIRHGLYIRTAVYAQVPVTRCEKIHNQQRSIIRLGVTRNGNTVIDVQILSITLSTHCWHWFQYWKEGDATSPIAGDGPGAQVAHFEIGGLSWGTFVGYNSFPNYILDSSHAVNPGTWGTIHTWNWTRRRWMGHIWEQRTIVDTGKGQPGYG